MTDAAYKIVAKLLKEKNIEFQIMIVDVDKLVDDENELQTRSMSFSFDGQYHPLQEVSRVFFDRKKADESSKKLFNLYLKKNDAVSDLFSIFYG